MPADGLPVIITELLPPFRTIEFAGRDRPEAGLSVAGEQRASQTHYPGTSKASVQFMGTREDPIVLKGWFQDPLSTLDGGPAARVALLRALMQSGGLCRLIWGDAILRVGRVKRVNAEYHKAGRIRYEVTFEVDQPSEAPSLRPSILGSGVAAALKAALATAVQAAQAVVGTVRAVKIIVGVVK